VLSTILHNVLQYADRLPAGGRCRAVLRMVFARWLQPDSLADKAPAGFGVPVRRPGAQKPVAVRRGNDIYLPVRWPCFTYVKIKIF